MNNENIIRSYKNVYHPLMNDFIKEIRGLNVEGMPQPFLPAFGSSYGSAVDKFAFAGMETNGWGKLKDLINSDKSSLRAEDFQWQSQDYADVLYGRNGSIRTFWSFVVKFLAGFHECEQRRIIDLDSESFMQSFVWGNCNSIESIGTINKNLRDSTDKVTYNNWEHIKNASKRFDHGKHIIEVFSPNTMIIMWWAPDESYLTEMLGTPIIKKTITDYLIYLEFQNVETRIIWTAHPSFLRRRRIEDNILSHCIKIAKEGIEGYD